MLFKLKCNYYLRVLNIFSNNVFYILFQKQNHKKRLEKQYININHIYIIYKNKNCYKNSI